MDYSLALPYNKSSNASHIKCTIKIDFDKSWTWLYEEDQNHERAKGDGKAEHFSLGYPDDLIDYLHYCTILLINPDADNQTNVTAKVHIKFEQGDELLQQWPGDQAKEISFSKSSEKLFFEIIREPK